MKTFKICISLNLISTFHGYISKSKSLNPSSKLPPGGIFEIQIPEQITEHEFKTSSGESNGERRIFSCVGFFMCVAVGFSSCVAVGSCVMFCRIFFMCSSRICVQV